MSTPLTIQHTTPDTVITFSDGRQYTYNRRHQEWQYLGRTDHKAPQLGHLILRTPDTLVWLVTERASPGFYLLQDSDLDKEDVRQGIPPVPHHHTEGLESFVVTNTDGPATELSVLPDDSGCFTLSLPLADDHWLYQERDEPPMGLKDRFPENTQAEIEEHVKAAAKYAIKAATDNGRIEDFDPDALLLNLRVGLFGYYPTPRILEEPETT